MFVIKIIIYIIALLMGVFFTVFILTTVETNSPSFQLNSDTLSKLIPKFVWVLISLLCAGLFSYLFLMRFGLSYIRAAIFSGLITGIPTYLKAGATVNHEDLDAEVPDSLQPKGFFDFFAGPDIPKKTKKTPQKSEADSAKNAARHRKRQKH